MKSLTHVGHAKERVLVILTGILSLMLYSRIDETKIKIGEELNVFIVHNLMIYNKLLSSITQNLLFHILFPELECIIGVIYSICVSSTVANIFFIQEEIVYVN